MFRKVSKLKGVSWGNAADAPTRVLGRRSAQQRILYYLLLPFNNMDVVVFLVHRCVDLHSRVLKPRSGMPVRFVLA